MISASLTTRVLKNPQLYKVRTRNLGAIEQMMKSINSTMTKAMSNFHIVSPSFGSYSFDQLLGALKRWDTKHIMLIKGRTVVKPWKERNEFESPQDDHGSEAT